MLALFFIQIKILILVQQVIGLTKKYYNYPR